MKVLICSKGELTKRKLDSFTHMISIQDSKVNQQSFCPSHIPNKNYLYLHFSDITNSDETDAPNKDELERLFFWVNSQKNVKALLIHCNAGLRRSPAIALFCIAFFESVNYITAMKKVEKSSLADNIEPNTLVVEIGDSIFNANGKAIEAVNNWQHRKKPFYRKIQTLIKLAFPRK